MLKSTFQIILILVVTALCGSKHYRGIVDFIWDAAQGNIPGISSINKFGHNPAIATTGEDIWGGGGTYGFYPDSATAMELVCDSAKDDSAGLGAWQVQVYGLDSNWLEINETVVANGDSAVALTYSYRRMYRAVCLTAGDSGTNVGAIAIRSVADSTVGAYIAADDGQTQQAIYTIPAGKSAYFVKGYVSMQNDDKNGQDAEFKWKVRLNNGTTGAWATKGQVDLINIGSSWWQYEYGVPAGPIPAKSDIRIECSGASATVGGVGGFDLILVDD